MTTTAPRLTPSRLGKPELLSQGVMASMTRNRPGNSSAPQLLKVAGYTPETSASLLSRLLGPYAATYSAPHRGEGWVCFGPLMLALTLPVSHASQAQSPTKRKTMGNSTNQLLTAAPQEGKTLSVVGDTYRLIITGKQTGGDYAMIDMLVPPGGGPGPHEHAAFHETYYVLDGEVLFQFEDKSITAKKGQLVSVPKGGGVHRFKNVSSANARMICTVVPSGLDEFFLEVGKPVAPDALLPHPPPMGPDEQQRMQAIAERYGQKLYPPNYFDKLKAN